MPAQTKALNYYNNGSAAASRSVAQAPTIRAMVEAETRRMNTPQTKTADTKDRVRKLEKIKAAADKKTAPGISVFAVLGTLFVAVLMVFVVLAQINFNETAGETARLGVHLNELTERHRSLELMFESAIDIKEVERYARDELGMSRPDTGQIVIINTSPRDNAMVINSNEARGVQGFGIFLKSVMKTAG